MLEELVGFETPVELLLGDEVVVHAVHLAGADSAGGRRHGERELRKALEQTLDQRALAGTGLAGDDEDRPSRHQWKTLDAINGGRRGQPAPRAAGRTILRPSSTG